SDRIPKAMSFLAPKLASRLECGLMTGIQPPDYETRLAILRAKTGKAGVEVQPEVLELLAANICSNVRELEGAVNQLLAYVRDNEVPPDVHVADQVLRQLGNSCAPKALAPGQVVESVASYFGVAAELLRSPRRDQKITLIRDVAVYFLRAHGVTLTEIGRLLGGRNHATILQGWRKVNAQLDTNPQLQQDISTLRSQLQPQSPPT
ncbi:MAG: DnaA/Hda family protein, partial [Chloroflexota bacterium]